MKHDVARLRRKYPAVFGGEGDEVGSTQVLIVRKVSPVSVADREHALRGYLGMAAFGGGRVENPSHITQLRTALVPVAGRGAEDCAVLELADDALEALVALQRHVLGVLVADGAEAAAELIGGDS